MGPLEPDFSGWATKAGLQCSDGRTILPNAFQHQDKQKVPLVWQHSHGTPKSILGHAILENRPQGVYTYCFFNNSAEAQAAKEAVRHGDIDRMSIWANELGQKVKQVFHGMIREVSLVIGGANPGAKIDNVKIRHSEPTGDGEVETWEEILPDELIIHTDTPLEHESLPSEFLDILHALNDEESDDNSNEGSGSESGNSNDESNSNENDEQRDDQVAETQEKTVQEVIETMNDEQQEVLHSLLSAALDSGDEDIIEHASEGDETVEDVYNSLTKIQKDVVNYMIGEAVSQAGGGSMAQSGIDDNDDNTGNTGTGNQEGDEVNDVVAHNVFENQGEETNSSRKGILAHDVLNQIVADAASSKASSLMEVFRDYAKNELKHGIEDIELLFPEAVSIDNTPQLHSRRTEWVQEFLPATRKVPFSRIKSVHFDLTFDEARAKGYVKGNLKKEEYIKAARRITTPTTVYKKQKLDRDDVTDITEFDVVAFLEAEMRLMLDEEVARAGLLGDGRAADDEDKINEEGIRPIVSDSEMYATQVFVNISDTDSDASEIVDAVIRNRQYLKGTGMPILFTKESVISKFLVLKDTLKRRIYKDINEVAVELRVSKIVPVEVMEEYPDILGILVNPADYTFGATKGGEISRFDQFDIDYNQHKYLIETRVCGALTKLKAALVLNSVAAELDLVVPLTPDFNEVEGELTITDVTGVVYTDASDDSELDNAGSPYSVASGESITVVATPDTGYFFETGATTTWTFTAQ